MKIVVDGLPIEQRECPFSKWHPYPPIVKDPGYYECEYGGKCSLTRNSMNECRMFIRLEALTKQIKE